MIALDKRRSGSLFFVELLVCLLFFSISGAVILKVFAAADVRAARNSAKENAVLCAQSVAEAYSVCGDAQQACLLVFGLTPQDDGGRLVVFLDENCAAVPIPSDITLSLTESRTSYPAGELAQLELVFSAESAELYSLTCSAYIPEKGGAASE